MINIQRKSLLIFLSLLAFSYSLCPNHCTTCDNSTSCQVCQTGFFLVNSTFCPPCPTGCAECAQGPNGRPACTQCLPPAQLGLNSQCFLCDPSCLNCTGQPRNCSSCPDGKILIPSNTINDTMICGQNPDCNIYNCLDCTTNPQNTTVCARCLPGYFPFKQGCVPCKFPCQVCAFDQEFIWVNTIGVFWNRLIRVAFNITASNPPPNVLPPFTNDLDFGNMNDTLKMGWTEAFWITQVIRPFIPSPQALIPLILPQIQFVNQILNLSGPVQQRAILGRINQLLNKTWTKDIFNNMKIQAASKYTLCIQCSVGYQNSTNVSIPCQRCQPRCLECSSEGCSRCQDGFYISSSGDCSPCTPPCATCSGTATTCQSCKPPNTLIGNQCITCTLPCDKCTPNNISFCISCRPPFAPQATQDGQCIRCNQDICVSCLSSNFSICLSCKVGATLVDGVCKLCPPNCVSCSSSTNPLCFECAQGFATVISGNITNCTRCRPGCLQCDPTNSSICLRCQNGTFLNPNNGVCQRCAKGCQQCTSLTACTIFDSGIVIISGQVIHCRLGCKNCDNTNPHICIECQQRFYLLPNNICQLCGGGCRTCTSPTTCTNCLDNLILDNGNCTKCTGKCLTCTPSNISQCTSCILGFTLVGSQCLQQCQRGCRECSATNSSICTNCLPGLALTPNGRCMKCLSSCSGRCDPKDPSICLNCADGFQLQNKKCVRCPPGCSACINGQCTDCLRGFTLNQTTNGSFVCQKNCKPPCSICSGTQCRVCSPGFKLNGTRCYPDLSCNPNCDFCPAGTQKLANGSCTRCPSNCANCEDGVCYGCQGGFYLNSGHCTTCPIQCFTCFDGNTCDLCNNGYVKQVLSMDSTGISNAVFGDQCIPCNSNCKTCQVDPDQCTSCYENFTLYSSRCSGIFTVIYNYQLNYQYQNFIQNSKSQDFIQTLARKINSNVNDTYIQTIKRGSILIGGRISTTSQTQASNVHSSLDSSIPGFSVLSSSATVYYGEAPYTPAAPQQQIKPVQKSVNIGLIVGLAVGGVVLIAVIIFLIYKFKCQKPTTKIEQGSQIQLNNQHPSRGQSNQIGIQKY